MLEIPENISPEALDFALRVLAHLEERCETNAQHLILQDGSGVRALRISHAEQILGTVRNQLNEEMEKAGDYIL